jgi:hypothetical protein
MRFAAISGLLTVLGALLSYYTVSVRQIIDWEKLQPLLDENSITTQAATLEFLQRLFEQGRLLNVLSRDSLILLMAGIFLGIGGLVMTIHFLVDKLFFKKFYEKPEIFSAVRRGLLAGLYPVAIIYLSLDNLLVFEIVLIITLIFFGVEFILATTFGNGQEDSLKSEERLG